MIDIEKEFYSLLLSFHASDVLKHLVLIGSWALKVYAENFEIKYFPFKTTDVDFSVKDPRSIIREATPTIHEILLEKGYTPEFGLISKEEKYIPGPGAFENQLSIDFLCKFGRHVKKPYPIKGLGIKVTPIVFQDILIDHAVSLRYKDVLINVPRPEFWAAHKIAISQKRSGNAAQIKMIKDLEGAGVIAEFIGDAGITAVASRFPGKFKNLFDRGWEIYKEKFKVDEIIRSQHL